ncbi:hypothetical protein AAG570_011198 [Ranatra chinensis]|uniref:ATP-dependent RNA helicase n=1 Tax=Ranatra chinensis TaxID=642074 RepID=A0ABD0YM35_9HEMI
MLFLFLPQVDSSCETFADLPLCGKTQKGLSENGYTVPTDIQRGCIGLALKGCDVLGAAKTGSGKTLAFLIPILEVLFRNKWSKIDGLGALVITPTRELALQIYQTLCKVGKHHDFSAGLIIGGKDLHFEKTRMHLVNIIICTPGRLLQHMDENPLFTCSNLKILVLDEADRCLDLGFEESMNCIIQNLPPERQTLLFSATQTKRVKDLIRLSLTDPKYISVHEHAKYRTPEGLTQSVVFCEQHEKMPMIWSFIKTHLKQKVIVFMSTCNQVRYTYDILCKLHPRVTLLALHSKLHQSKRMEIYQSFCNKQFAFLFATDLAARGLDFPQVNWVIQLDCPEDVDTYIHRVGRTGRYQKGGEGLLVLRPAERPMLEYLQNSRIPISEIKINPSRIFSPHVKIEAHLAMYPELKASAQRAFVSYAKSVFLMKDKTVFDVKSIDHDKYARSLGLVISPRIRFLKRAEKKAQSLPTTTEENINSEDKSEEDEEDKENDDEEEIPKEIGGKDGSDSEDDVLVLKRKLEVPADIDTSADLGENPNKKLKVITKAALAKRTLKKNILPNKKIVYTEEGEVMLDKMKEKITEAGRNYEANISEGGINIDEAKVVLKEEDKWDRKLFREKVKARKRAMKRKLKEEKRRELAGDPESSGDDGELPDLSWLPDPDVVYGKKSQEETLVFLFILTPDRMFLLSCFFIITFFFFFFIGMSKRTTTKRSLQRTGNPMQNHRTSTCLSEIKKK